MYYFAFGSNLSAQQLEKRNVCFKERIPAFIYDYKLVFNKKATGKPNQTYANIEYEKGSLVEGVLYLTDMKSIKNLDYYEGVDSNNYIRQEMEVTLKSDLSKVKAWVYIAHPSKICSGKPSKPYLNLILTGKDLLTDSYYQNLLKVETV